MANCLLSLGSNLGDRGAHLQAALRSLGSLPETTLLAQSSFCDTKPAGGPPAQDPFLNAAARIETSLTPQQLLAELQRIEKELGRVRSERWGPRTIDLDLLLYDQLELESAELTLPHPRMSFRRFVLEPAAEIAGEMVYPINRWTIGRLVGHLQPWNRTIVLRSQDRSREKLLAMFAENQDVAVLKNEKLTLAGLRSREIELRRKRGASDQARKCRQWIITDINLQIPVPANAETRTTAVRTVPPALVVVWQGLANGLESLNRTRHLKSRGPHLWIPGVSLDQARQEVIAAMAAME